MEELLIFYSTHGLWLTIIAVLGVIFLGIMKYANLFEKINETYRHYFYIGISIALSLIFGLVYLLIEKAFDFKSYFLFGSSVFALNQTFYNIFKVTSLTNLFKTLVEKIFNKLKNN